MAINISSVVEVYRLVAPPSLVFIFVESGFHPATYLCENQPTFIRIGFSPSAELEFLGSGLRSEPLEEMRGEVAGDVDRVVFDDEHLRIELDDTPPQSQ